MASEEGTSCVGNDSLLPDVGWGGVEAGGGQFSAYANMLLLNNCCGGVAVCLVLGAALWKGEYQRCAMKRGCLGVPHCHRVH